MTTTPAAPSSAARGSDARAAAAAGQRAAANRRHERVLAIITAAATRTGGPALSATAIARAAGVHRSYLYRHPDLLDLLHRAAREAGSPPDEGDQVTSVSLHADLAHARDRARRAEDDNRALRRRLSEALGQQVWADTGLGPLDEAAALRAEVERLRQQLADLTVELEEHRGDLDAARAANRELMTRVNGTGRAAPPR